MNNLKKKIASRKFWAMLGGLVTSIVLMVQGDPTITISGVIMGVGSIVAYILGESWIDAASAKSTTTTTNISASTTAKEVVVDAMNGAKND